MSDTFKISHIYRICFSYLLHIFNPFGKYQTFGELPVMSRMKAIINYVS